MEWFTSEHPLICMGGCFYDVDGRIETGRLRRLIAESIRPYINRDCSQQISKIIATMTDFLDSDEYEPEEGWLFFANGDYCISEKMLYPKSKICFNRLPVNYIESASEAEVTMKFLSELLAPDDIRTLQEFFGYMFLPSNPGQKMLMILGEGGEGKSQVGEMVKALFGDLDSPPSSEYQQSAFGCCETRTHSFKSRCLGKAPEKRKIQAGFSQ